MRYHLQIEFTSFSKNKKIQWQLVLVKWAYHTLLLGALTSKNLSEKQMGNIIYIKSFRKFKAFNITLYF